MVQVAVEFVGDLGHNGSIHVNPVEIFLFIGLVGFLVGHGIRVH